MTVCESVRRKLLCLSPSSNLFLAFLSDFECVFTCHFCKLLLGFRSFIVSCIYFCLKQTWVLYIRKWKFEKSWENHIVASLGNQLWIEKKREKNDEWWKRKKLNIYVEYSKKKLEISVISPIIGQFCYIFCHLSVIIRFRSVLLYIDRVVFSLLIFHNFGEVIKRQLKWVATLG